MKSGRPLAAHGRRAPQHLERVSDGRAERLVHVGEQADDLAARLRAERRHRLGEQARVVDRLHERAVADLDVEHDRLRARGELLRHDARRDQRDLVDRRRHVAQRVEHLVGGDEVAGLADDREPDLAHLGDELLRRQLDAEARDRLELVERPAGVPEPAAAHLPERHAARGHDRADRERRLVADAAGRVLVDDLAPERRAEVDRLAAAHHRVGQRERLARATAPGRRPPCRTPPADSRAPRRARTRARARRARRRASSSPSRLRSMSSAGRIIFVGHEDRIRTRGRAKRLRRSRRQLGREGRHHDRGARRTSATSAPSGERRLAVEVVPLDVHEVRGEKLARRSPALNDSATARRPTSSRSSQVEAASSWPRRAGRRAAAPARARREPRSRSGDVVEHPRRDGAVELAVGERQLLDVAEPGVDPALRPPARPSAARDRSPPPPPPSLARDPLGQLAPARSRPRGRAAGATSATASTMRARERRRPSRTPVYAARAPRSPTRPRTRPRRARVVEAVTTRGRRCREPRPARLPPSHALTVAPTSANSPPRGYGRSRSGPRRRRAAARARASGPSRASSGRSRGRRSGSAGRRGEGRRGRPAAAGRSPAGSGGSSRGRCGAPRAMSVSTRFVKIEPVVDARGAAPRCGSPRRSTWSGSPRRCPAGEDVADLADAVHLVAGSRIERKVVRPARREREVVPVGVRT